MKLKFGSSVKTKLKCNVTSFHKNGKNARLGLNILYKDGLYPKFEEKPINEQNKTLSKFLDETACPFHSVMDSRICSNFMEFGQNCNFYGNCGNCHFRNDKNCMNVC